MPSNQQQQQLSIKSMKYPRPQLLFLLVEEGGRVLGFVRREKRRGERRREEERFNSQ